MFSAQLRLPESVSRREKRARVEEVMATLGLTHVADVRVGGSGGGGRSARRGISGGEKRRVSIGVELVTSPAVIVLDEPTSGLDSFNALAVIRTLSDLAHKSQKTVIFTIHQPRSDAYILFDQVLVLSKGEPLYFGPGKEAAAHFKAKGYPCPHGYNIADHLLDMASSDSIVGKKPLSASTEMIRMISAGSISLSDGNATVGRRNSSVELEYERVQKTELPTADMEQGLLSYQDANPESGVSLSRRISSAILETLVPVEKPKKAKSMRVGFVTQTLILSGRNFKNLIRTPSLLLAHIMFSLVLGGFIGGLYYNSGNTLAGVQNRFGSILFILAVLGFSGLSAIGLFANEKLLFVTIVIAPAAIIGSITFYLIGFTKDGNPISLRFLINQNSIPSQIQWIQYLSFFKYAYEAMVINDLNGLQIQDTVNGVVLNIPASVVLTKFGFDISAYWRDLAVSAGIAIGLLVINAALMQFKLKEMR
ncbi:hypothetical protein HDU83_000648 [Entophlyctis luteolus]|nr:hypothetical protein HDU83_000648 [Entophlyctis luteolus]